MEKDTVINICGKYPENFFPASISSNPNYVFENDITYTPVQLYDVEENTVFFFFEIHIVETAMRQVIYSFLTN